MEPCSEMISSRDEKLDEGRFIRIRRSFPLILPGYSGPARGTGEPQEGQERIIMRKVRAPRFFPDGRLKLPASNLQIPPGAWRWRRHQFASAGKLNRALPLPTSNQNLNLRNGSLVMARFLSSRLRGWLTAPGHSTARLPLILPPLLFTPLFFLSTKCGYWEIRG